MSERTDAQRRDDRAYKEKHKPIFISICYNTDEEIGEKLKKYLSETDQTANNYIKGLIAADLQGKGII